MLYVVVMLLFTTWMFRINKWWSGPWSWNIWIENCFPSNTSFLISRNRYLLTVRTYVAYNTVTPIVYYLLPFIYSFLFKWSRHSLNIPLFPSWHFRNSMPISWTKTYIAASSEFSMHISYTLEISLNLRWFVRIYFK